GHGVAERREELQAIHARKPQVDEPDMRLEGDRLEQRLLGGGERVHVEARRRDLAREHAAQRRVIFDEQHARGHAASSGSSATSAFGSRTRNSAPPFVPRSTWTLPPWPSAMLC